MFFIWGVRYTCTTSLVTRDTCHDTHHTDDEDIAHQAHCHDHSEGHGHDVLGQSEHHLVVNIRGVVHCHHCTQSLYDSNNDGIPSAVGLCVGGSGRD